MVQEQEPEGEPFLQWDGETEDAYRRALHLWKVRGKPGEAADILLGLADTQSVTQLPGQASWVLVIAAQCLVEAGRTEEAAAILPGIERGAKGTKLEEFVRRELDAHSLLTGMKQDGLDTAFLQSLIEVFEGPDGSGIKGFVSQYHRALNPYLLQALDLWKSGGAVKNVGIFAFRYALVYLDRASLPRLIQFTDELSHISFLTIVQDPLDYWDDAAVSAAWSYWEHLADSPNAERADRGRRALGRMAKGYASQVGSLLTARIRAGDRELETIWLSFIKGVDKPAYREIFDVAYRGGGEHRWMALEHAYLTAAVEDLLRLAEGGDVDAAVIACALAARLELRNTWTHSQGQTSNELHAVIDQKLSHLIGRQVSITRPKTRTPIRDLPAGSWNVALELLERRVRQGEPEAQTLLALAALALDRGELLRTALQDLPVSEQPVMIAVVMEQRLHDIFPDDVAWNWSAQAVKPEERLTFDHKLSELLSMNAAEASVEQVRTRLEFLRESEILGLFGARWRSAGRIEDLIALMSDESLSSRVWVGLLSAFGSGVDGTDARVLPMIAERLRHGALVEDEARSPIFGYCASLVERHQQPFTHVTEAQLRVVLEFHYSSNHPSGFVQRLASAKGTLSTKVRSDFCSDLPRTRFLLKSWPNEPASEVLLAALRLGMPIEEALSSRLPRIPPSLPAGSPERIEAIQLLLRSQLPADRRCAVLWLRADRAAYEVTKGDLQPLWTDPDHAAYVAIQLGEYRDFDPDIVSSMIEAWRLDGLQERTLLIQALGNSFDRRVVPILMEAISDSEPKVAEAAREGLERMKEIEEQRAFWESWQATGVGGSPEAALLKQVQSQNREVQLAAIKALGALQSKNALPLLISLLESPVPEVAAAARLALNWISDPIPAAEPPK